MWGLAFPRAQSFTRLRQTSKTQKQTQVSPTKASDAKNHAPTHGHLLTRLLTRPAQPTSLLRLAFTGETLQKQIYEIGSWRGRVLEYRYDIQFDSDIRSLVNITRNQVYFEFGQSMLKRAKLLFQNF